MKRHLPVGQQSRAAGAHNLSFQTGSLSARLCGVPHCPAPESDRMNEWSARKARRLCFLVEFSTQGAEGLHLTERNWFPGDCHRAGPMENSRVRTHREKRAAPIELSESVLGSAPATPTRRHTPIHTITPASLHTTIPHPPSMSAWSFLDPARPGSRPFSALRLARPYISRSAPTPPTR